MTSDFRLGLLQACLAPGRVVFDHETECLCPSLDQTVVVRTPGLATCKEFDGQMWSAVFTESPWLAWVIRLLVQCNMHA